MMGLMNESCLHARVYLHNWKKCCGFFQTNQIRNGVQSPAWRHIHKDTRMLMKHKCRHFGKDLSHMGHLYSKIKRK